MARGRSGVFEILTTNHGMSHTTCTSTNLEKTQQRILPVQYDKVCFQWHICFTIM